MVTVRRRLLATGAARYRSGIGVLLRRLPGAQLTGPLPTKDRGAGPPSRGPFGGRRLAVHEVAGPEDCVSRPLTGSCERYKRSCEVLGGLTDRWGTPPLAKLRSPGAGLERFECRRGTLVSRGGVSGRTFLCTFRLVPTTMQPDEISAMHPHVAVQEWWGETLEPDSVERLAQAPTEH